MKVVNSTCLFLAACILAYITFSTISSAWASGYLPVPVATNDPAGNVDPEVLHQAACDLMDDYVRVGLPLHGYKTIVGLEDWTDNEYYVYYFYIQDLLDICLVMRSI